MKKSLLNFRNTRNIKRNQNELKKRIGTLAGILAMTTVISIPVCAEIPHYSLEEFPVIDGSLACVPLITTLIQNSTSCSDSEAEDFNFSNTNPSYLNLAEGKRDLILSYEASDETKETLESGSWKDYDGNEFSYADAELEMTEIGRDALVFLVNAENPIDSLTKEQAADIFTGKIKNWSEIGGEDAEIITFIRPENSGSQTLMRKLLVGDADMAQEQTMEVPSMDGMIEKLRNYDNAANSIGYSVYYYTEKMMSDPQIKILKIDGVFPTSDSIRSGEYSLINPFYCVTAKNSSENALELRDWLIGDEGQELLEKCGYVGIR